MRSLTPVVLLLTASLLGCSQTAPTSGGRSVAATQPDKLVIMVYDARDILERMDAVQGARTVHMDAPWWRSLPSPATRPDAGSIFANCPSFVTDAMMELREARLATLMAAIERALPPDQWTADTRIMDIDGLLVVRLSQDSHKRVERLLADLRARPPQQATVELRAFPVVSQKEAGPLFAWLSKSAKLTPGSKPVQVTLSEEQANVFLQEAEQAGLKRTSIRVTLVDGQCAMVLNEMVYDWPPGPDDPPRLLPRKLKLPTDGRPEPVEVKFYGGPTWSVRLVLPPDERYVVVSTGVAFAGLHGAGPAFWGVSGDTTFGMTKEQAVLWCLPVDEMTAMKAVPADAKATEFEIVAQPARPSGPPRYCFILFHARRIVVEELEP